MKTEYNLLAIYFRMGQYNKDDEVPSEIVGLDCPFDDSPVLYAGNEAELERKVQEVYRGTYDFAGRKWAGVDWRGLYPDVICDQKGIIQTELYRRICQDKEFDPNVVRYSFGRETLTSLWEREKWRWIKDQR